MTSDAAGGTPPRAETADPMRLVEEARTATSGASERLATFILRNSHTVGGMSITDLSRAAQVSPTTVTRFARLVGFDGFPQLRFAFAREAGRAVEAGWAHDIGTDILPGDSPDQVLDIVAAAQYRALRRASEVVDVALASDVAARIVAARRIGIYAEWGDSIAARELQMRLFRIGMHAWLHTDPQEGNYGAGLFEPGDVMIAVSHAGKSSLAQQLLRDAAHAGAHTVAVTSTADTPLAITADTVLQSGSTASQSTLPVFGARPGQMLVTGFLWLLVAQRAPERVAHAASLIDGTAWGHDRSLPQHAE